MQDADLIWRTFCYQVRDRRGKLVDVWVSEGHEDISRMGCGFMRTRCTGPNGLQTETIQQMLELLGADPPAGMPWLKPSEPAAVPPTVEQPALAPPAISETEVEETVAPETQHASLQELREISMAEAWEPRKSITTEQYAKPEANVRNSNEYDIYEAEELDDVQDEEDDSRPQPITAEDIARIDCMSPDELNALIEDVDAHEEWEELRRDAKERIECWTGALKKADEAPRCAHIKSNGKSCGSPAMKDEALCYFHSQTRSKREASASSPVLEIPSLEDRLGVQLAIMRVCNMLAEKTLDEKTGRAVLAGLRLAHRNLGGGHALYGGLHDPD